MTLSRKIVQSARRLTMADLTPDVVAKVKTGLLDMLSCALESQDLPWSTQAIQLAQQNQGGRAAVIGTPIRTSPAQAAFTNATLAHGLVREDMHIASVSHLGVVIYPALLALAEAHEATGEDFIIAAVCGYEVGAGLGRAIMDADIVRRFRPTGITGPLAAAAAGSRLLGLSEEASISALGLAANATGGLNEWPYCGGDEMFVHPGFAARNAVTAVELAKLGACASETALDGRAGLLAAFNKSSKAAEIAPFSGPPEILSIYFKPAPACNYAQTACQAASVLATRHKLPSREISSLRVKLPAAAIAYPGCNFAGPFERILQAKMSIQYCVAATLACGKIEESNYRLLENPEILRLARLIELERDPDFTRNYPGRQGAEVILNGHLSHRMEDLEPATPAAIRARFTDQDLVAAVDRLETAKRISDLPFLTQTLTCKSTAC